MSKLNPAMNKSVICRREIFLTQKQINKRKADPLYVMAKVLRGSRWERSFPERTETPKESVRLRAFDAVLIKDKTSVEKSQDEGKGCWAFYGGVDGEA